jgi:hypothetical protein
MEDFVSLFERITDEPANFYVCGFLVRDRGASSQGHWKPTDATAAPDNEGTLPPMSKALL